MEGAPLAPGALVARLDPTLEASGLAARQSEARAAEDQLALVQAGARAEEIRATRARLEAARANERLLATSAARVRALFEAEATTRAALDEVEAQHARARADAAALAESLRAQERGARPPELGAARHRLEAAQAAARGQEARVERHALRALHPGEVLEVHVRPGELAAVGAPIVTVADTTRPYADVFVPQAELAGLRPGVAAWGRVDGVAQEIPGRIELVFRRTEFTPRYLFSERERGLLVVRVRVRFDDDARALHAGVPVFVRFAPEARP